MADRKISELTNITGVDLADGDELVVVDASASETKAITFGEFKNALDTATGFVSITGDTMTGDLSFGDNDKAIFGAGSDLQIYHDGSNSYLTEAGAGNLYIGGENHIFLTNSAGTQTYAAFNGPTGWAKLYYSNSEKLATTTTGIDVTGTVTADGLTVVNTSNDPAFTISGNNDASGTKTTLRFHDTDTTSTNGQQLGKIEFYSSDIGNSFGPAVYAEIDAKATSSQPGSKFTFRTVDIAGTSLNDRMLIDANGDISFYEDTGTTAKFFWDASAERLGIGTSSPPETLSVVNLGSSGTGTQIFSGTTNTQPRFKARTESYNGVVSVYDSGSNEDVRISAASGIDTYFNSGSNVGIGTSSPSYLLHVSNSASAGDVAVNVQNTSNSASGSATLRLSTSTVTTRGAFVRGLSSSASGQPTDLLFGTGSAYADATERMRIDSSGNVGIGTSSPSKTLHLKSTAPILYFEETDIPQAFSIGSGGGKFFVYDETDAAQRLTIDGDGNVGIGTSSPSSKLHLSVSSGTVQQQFSNGGTSSYIGHDASFSGLDVAAGGGIRLRYFNGVAFAEAMRIDSSGNLLVGKTSTNTINTVGHDITDHGEVMHTTDGGTTMYLNRKTSDGTIIDLRKDGTTVASIGTLTGDMYLGTGDTGLYFLDSSDAIIPANPSSPSVSNGIVNLGQPSYRFKDLYLSGGVYLGGTGAANKLDSYEEGTFTPVLTTDGTAPSFTYSNQKGYYTKVGDLVNVYIYFSISALGSAGTGNAKITGLPFTSNANIQGGLSNNWSSVAWATNCPEAAHIPVNSTEALPVFINGAVTSRITSSNFDAGFECILHGSYKTA